MAEEAVGSLRSVSVESGRSLVNWNEKFRHRKRWPKTENNWPHLLNEDVACHDWQSHPLYSIKLCQAKIYRYIPKPFHFTENRLIVMEPATTWYILKPFWGIFITSDKHYALQVRARMKHSYACAEKQSRKIIKFCKLMCLWRVIMMIFYSSPHPHLSTTW